MDTRIVDLLTTNNFEVASVRYSYPSDENRFGGLMVKVGEGRAAVASMDEPWRIKSSWFLFVDLTKNVLDEERVQMILQKRKQRKNK